MATGSRTPQGAATLRAARSVLLLVVLTSGSLYAIGGDAFPPHGNPIVYSLAMSWLISLAVAILSSALFLTANPALFSLARWENEGRIYERAGIRAFRWILLHSPLGWINGSLHFGSTRADCEELLRQLNAAEGVHWLTCLASVTLAVAVILDDASVYGYSMLLVRIPFDLYPIMLQRWNRGRVSRVLNRSAQQAKV